MLPASVLRCFPFLSWPRPDRTLLRGEFWAGMTVGLMLVPQSVAYAALAGMPLVTGIYAALIPALVAVLWSSSTRLGVGPTALTSLLIGASLTGLAEPGSAQWVALAVWMALLSGLLQLLLGLARFGWLLHLVTSPVLGGFTQAAALLILVSQLPALAGLRIPLTEWASAPALAQFDLAGAGFGLGSVLALVLARRWWPNFPAVIVVMGLAAVLSSALGYAAGGGAVVGALPAGLPHLYWPGALPWDTLGALTMPVLAVTLMSFLETASSAKVDHQDSGTRWNENQDLIAHGLAKISAGLCGSFATSASFSRSAINLYAGARSGWASVFATALVLVALLWLTPALYHVPQAVLAAVVVTAITGLLKPGMFMQLWRVSHAEALIGVLTFALTLATAPRLYWGVLVGLLVNLSHFLYQRLHPRIIEVGLHPDGSLRDRHLWQLPPLAPGLLALRMDAALDFASASALEHTISEHLAAQPDIKHVCLFAQPINRIDVTGVQAFARLQALVRSRGGVLHISGLKLPVEQVLRRAQVLVPGPQVRMHRTDAEALRELRPVAHAPASTNRNNAPPPRPHERASRLHLDNCCDSMHVPHSAPPSLIDLRDLRLDTALALTGQAGASHPALADRSAAQYLQELIDGLCELSLKDPLTGLANRRHFRAVVEREIDRVTRSGEAALLLMLDIDNFKKVNDTYGHLAGDMVLQAVAQTLNTCVRPMDTLARYGGEEFAVVLPACQAAFGKAVADRIRRAVAATAIHISPSIELHVTISIGGAFALQWIRSTTTLWTDRADHQLYEAKSAGRNCVRIEEQPDSTVSAEEKGLLFGPLYTPSGWGELPPLNYNDSAH